jgi:hypothetical protein
MKRLLLFTIVPVLSFFASCEKAEKPVTLPPRGSSTPATVNMGHDLQDQIFYDLETNQVVYTSTINSWDIALEASPNGYHVFINGVKLRLYNTHNSDFTHFKQSDIDNNIAYDDWKCDASCGLPDSTIMGNWRDASGLSKNEVYILQDNSDPLSPIYYKLKMLSVTPTEYKIIISDINGVNAKNITLHKEDDFNFIYYSFTDGIVNPEPPKTSWDIVFTRYIYQYYEMGGFPYTVVGALLNPYKTSAALLDSNGNYSKVDVHALDTVKLSNFRDAIGFEWKQYSQSTGKYIVFKDKVYIINTKSNAYWKLHFLDYYDKDGWRGSPSFEFERLK